MNKLLTNKKIWLNWALCVSIATLVAIGAILVGIIFDIVLVLVVGIGLVIIGLITSSFLWLKYSDYVFLMDILNCFENEHIYSTRRIAKHLSTNKNAVAHAINQAIKHKYIQDYVFDGEQLTLNEDSNQNKSKISTVCPSCSAKITVSIDNPFCPYCNTKIENKEEKIIKTKILLKDSTKDTKKELEKEKNKIDKTANNKLIDKNINIIVK